MKTLTDTSTIFDRTSTREELFQVIELLGGRRTEFPLSASAASEQKVSSDSAVHGVDLWDDVATDEELSLAAEIQPLADLFNGKRQRIN